MTVRDFSLIFDAYTQFEESVLQAKMEAMAEDEEEEGGEGELLLEREVLKEHL